MVCYVSWPNCSDARALNLSLVRESVPILPIRALGPVRIGGYIRYSPMRMAADGLYSALRPAELLRRLVGLIDGGGLCGRQVPELLTA